MNYNGYNNYVAWNLCGNNLTELFKVKEVPVEKKEEVVDTTVDP